MIGKILKDRYSIRSFIAEGGMAKVYYGEDIITKREIAVKIIKEETSLDPLNIARFQREAKASAALTHPNIVEIYDVDVYEDRPYMVMEYVKSKSLKELLTIRGPFSVVEALDIVYQLSDALMHAHQKGVIHRDVKPQNVMMQFDGSAKLGDFGIALINDAPQITQKDMVMGSVHYMAPEVAKGEGASQASDIYSLGITFFELLTGKLPFSDANAINVAMKHINEPLPSIRDINDQIPVKVEKVINKACQKTLKKRYLSAKEFKKDIENLMRIPFKKPSGFFFTKLFKKRKKDE